MNVDDFLADCERQCENTPVASRERLRTAIAIIKKLREQRNGWTVDRNHYSDEAMASYLNDENKDLEAIIERGMK